MGLRIFSNIASLNTQRHLYNTTYALGKTYERLSSGLRINRAADDAAGLAISEGLKSDIRALAQASRNAADGISMIQVAEGGLDEVSSILIRMKELTVHARTGTLSDDQRSHLDLEYTALRAEIQRISDSVDFNGIKLLDGTGGLRDIQVGIGASASDRIAVDLSSDMDINGLSLNTNIQTWGSSATAMIEVDNAARAVLEVRAHFGATQNRLESSIRATDMTAENLAAANSRIRDADIAFEMSTLSSQQILQQAAISMLAQANLAPQLALKLLTG